MGLSAQADWDQLLQQSESLATKVGATINGSQHTAISVCCDRPLNSQSPCIKNILPFNKANFRAFAGQPWVAATATRHYTSGGAVLAAEG